MIKTESFTAKPLTVVLDRLHSPHSLIMMSRKSLDSFIMIFSHLLMYNVSFESRWWRSLVDKVFLWSIAGKPPFIVFSFKKHFNWPLIISLYACHNLNGEQVIKFIQKCHPIEGPSFLCLPPSNLHLCHGYVRKSLPVPFPSYGHSITRKNGN